MSEGKSFHIGLHAPATGKVRRPAVESLTAGTDNQVVSRNHAGQRTVDQGGYLD